MSSDGLSSQLETVLSWARSGHEWNKVYNFLFLHPEDFFTVVEKRNWPIAHQVVYHGNVDILKRILALFSDDQIDIHTLSKDEKTLLDVATERQNMYPEMYTYMQHLFLQDDLMRAAKQSNWRLVEDILTKNPDLANEKPSYSTYFVLHYVVQNGNNDILRDFLERFQFQTDISNADNETPFQLAKQMRKDDMCAILESKTQDQLRPNQTRTRPSLPSARFIIASNKNQTSAASPTHTSLTNTSAPCLGFGNIVLELSKNGSLILSTQNPFSSMTSLPSLPEESQQMPTVNATSKTDTTEKRNLNPESTPKTPGTPTTNAHLMKKFTCVLTQQVFVDPVIASDGHTYERDAITKWISVYPWSPTTGARLEPTFKDNTELKKTIQSMQTLS